MHIVGFTASEMDTQNTKMDREKKSPQKSAIDVGRDVVGELAVAPYIQS